MVYAWWWIRGESAVVLYTYLMPRIRFNWIAKCIFVDVLLGMYLLTVEWNQICSQYSPLFSTLMYWLRLFNIASSENHDFNCTYESYFGTKTVVNSKVFHHQIHCSFSIRHHTIRRYSTTQKSIRKSKVKKSCLSNSPALEPRSSVALPRIQAPRYIAQPWHCKHVKRVNSPNRTRRTWAVRYAKIAGHRRKMYTKKRKKVCLFAFACVDRRRTTIRKSVWRVCMYIGRYTEQYRRLRIREGSLGCTQT